MKIFQIKLKVTILIISLVTILALSNCGQQDNSKKTEGNPESIKEEVKTPVVTTDTSAPVAINPVNSKKTENTKQEIKADVKEEVIPAVKIKVPEPVKNPTTEQPVGAGKKPVVNTNITPSIEKPVAKPEEIPVVKVPEPIKPKPDTVAKPDIVTKPVTIDKPQPEQGTWIVPARYKSMTSPFPVNKETFDLGKTLYGTHCKSCHGPKGEGNGPKAAQLDTEMGSFLSTGFLSQKPGEVFYKTNVGRKDMPKYEKKIPEEEDRWAIVYYIMNLKN